MIGFAVDVLFVVGFFYLATSVFMVMPVLLADSAVRGHLSRKGAVAASLFWLPLLLYTHYTTVHS